MTTTISERTAQIVDHKRRIGEYKETVRRLFPALQRDLVDARSIKDVDAIVLALFLRCYPHELSVLEVGARFGVSTFHLASQPSVLRVLGVVPDLAEDGKASETSSTTDTQCDLEPLPGLRVIDIARAALAEFADESAKIQLRTGNVSSAWTANQDGSADSTEETQLPTPGLSEDEPLLAILNEARPKGAVDADLRAIFEANPRAVAILDHCRGVGGPFVQAGVADFMKHAQGEYHFRLFSDLTTGMATSNLGIVYPDAGAAEVQRCLADLAQLFSERLDPLSLACREQELIGIVNTFKDEANGLSGQLQDLTGEHQLLANRNKELEKRISQLEKRKTQLEQRTADLKKEKKELQSRTTQLEKRKTQLEERNTGLREEKKRLQKLKEEKLLLDSQLSDYRTAGRYKLADAVTKSVLRIPGAKALARRTRPKE